MITTLAQQFAAEYAKGVVPAMLKAINAARRDTRIIVAGVLAITYPHQTIWLTSLHGLEILGYAVPAVVDLAMLRMLGIVQTVGMRRPAKFSALVMAGVLGTMSGAVNVAAPADPAVRAIFGALVLVAVGVKIVTSLVGPDFAAIEATETLATTAITVTAGPDPVRSERARRAAQTRRDNAAREAAEKAAAAETRRLARQQRRDDARADAAGLFARIAAETEPGYVDSVAPVSPAIA